MDIKIITKGLHLEIFGFSDIAVSGDYAGTALKISGKMWEIVKANEIPNKGKNIWVYDTAERIFAGVELDNPSGSRYGLEKMTIDIGKYAYYKHVGSYKHIKAVGQSITNELNKQKHEIISPYIEIYGHWNKDESKLETEILMCLR